MKNAYNAPFVSNGIYVQPHMLAAALWGADCTDAVLNDELRTSLLINSFHDSLSSHLRTVDRDRANIIYQYTVTDVCSDKYRRLSAALDLFNSELALSEDASLALHRDGHAVLDHFGNTRDYVCAPSGLLLYSFPEKGDCQALGDLFDIPHFSHAAHHCAAYFSQCVTNFARSAVRACQHEMEPPRSVVSHADERISFYMSADSGKCFDDNTFFAESHNSVSAPTSALGERNGFLRPSDGTGGARLFDTLKALAHSRSSIARTLLALCCIAYSAAHAKFEAMRQLSEEDKKRAYRSAQPHTMHDTLHFAHCHTEQFYRDVASKKGLTVNDLFNILLRTLAFIDVSLPNDVVAVFGAELRKDNIGHTAVENLFPKKFDNPDSDEANIIYISGSISRLRKAARRSDARRSSDIHF